MEKLENQIEKVIVELKLLIKNNDTKDKIEEKRIQLDHLLEKYLQNNKK